ncbi:Mitochondrial protein cyt-4 [Cytospora mali]|uniref:Mitochondrial protein cyt-4 n=1 Tax=Cytospora mali TaxID=578113 RepID=A0A194VPB4_CYTMA|nr:Mitochondrial protein cyt-4 [Valsa mali]
MRNSAAGSRACLTCLTRRLQPSRLSSSTLGSRTFRASALRAYGASPASRRFGLLQDFATVQDAPQNNTAGDSVQSIRQRLRQWEAEHKISVPTGMPSDNGDAAKPRNLLTRARNLDEVASGQEDGTAKADQPVPDKDGLFELFPPPSSFKAGDLIEMHEDGERMALLAVCLGYINGSYHFYTATGKWHPAQGMSTHFVVRDFASEKDMGPVIEKLPKGDLPEETLRMMRELKMGPDRTCGAVLLRKMAKFQEQAEIVLQRLATRLENAHKILAEEDARYLTLEQMASHLMGRPLNVPLNPASLYAVHRTVLSDDVGFRLLGKLGNARTWLFEITPPGDVALIENMQTLVRLFTDIPAKVDTPLPELTSSQLCQSQLGRFILKAREAIDHSRQCREWTPHGMLGPAKKPTSPAGTHWTDVDLSILHFMHMWAGCDQFSSSSRFHWIGSAILRATARYKDSEYLSMTTGWTFLQELGYIAPWDIQARYTKRLPGIKPSRAGGFTRMTLGPGGISTHLTPDPFMGKRKEWTDHRVFAVDSKDTTDIDDALSLEPAETPGEYWIHVHVADPAARILPKSALGERAQLVPLNLYLSGHESNIWGVGDEIKKLFSLGPNKPCLTFSGKVNEEGELLDYTITPGKLHDYIFMTPEEVNTAVGFKDSRRPPTWSTAQGFRVGKPPAQKAENRKMTSAAELQPEDLESLKTLHRLAQAIRERRLAKGAMPVFSLRPNVKASFDETSIKETPQGLIASNGDPFISISWDEGKESPMVTNTMTLAGEIAAQWCAKRNIAIPYITQPNAEKNLELLKPYSEKVYAKLLLGEEPAPEETAQLRALIGADEMSTRPGSHFLMGVPCYAKVTSPLRRYSDLVAHWQIQDALVQEAETGRVVETRLPFSRNCLEKEVFPWLRLRQRVIQQLGNWAGSEAYMRQALVRAWKFPGEGDSRLPDTFRLKVQRTQGGFQKLVSGSLDWFGLEARMGVDGLAALGVALGDIRKDDVFEVKLKDVNVHLGEVLVEAVGKVKVQADVQGAVAAVIGEVPAAEAEVQAKL